ncbi:hypothetical protein RQN30_00310 [Arcanobacterium hippocoleae]
MNNLRTALSETALTLTYSDEQQLLGFSGMAKSWTNYGVSHEAAQEAETLFSKVSARIERAVFPRMLFTSAKQQPFPASAAVLVSSFTCWDTIFWRLVNFCFQTLLWAEKFAGQLRNQI